MLFALLALQLVLGGFVTFDLQARTAGPVAVQWLAILIGGGLLTWTIRLLRRGDGAPARFARPAFGLVLVGGFLLSGLGLTVPADAYEIERYVRGLLLCIAVHGVANAAPLGFLMWLCYAVTGRRRFAIALVAVLHLLLHALHIGKYVVLQQHLQAWDHMLFGDLLEVMPLLLGTPGVVLLAGVGAAVLVALAFVWRRDTARTPPGERMRGLALSAVAVSAVGLGLHLGGSARLEDPADYFPLWNRHTYNAHHTKSGLGLTLLRGTRMLALQRAPAGYGPEAMAAIRERYPRGTNAVVPDADVILYMIESLEDLSAYGVRYATDPLPHFHALAKRGAGGRLYVPIYGGNTPNTEFEVLTGLSRVRPWPHDLAYAYRQWIDDDTRALPWTFRRWGYRTAVIAGATGKYFGQRAAYPRLGFDAFHALGDRDGVPRKFGLISDFAVVDEIIELLGSGDQAEAGGAVRRPWFLSVTTDATHGPYRGDHDPEDDRFALVGSTLPADAQAVAVDYARALHHADQALGKLVAFLEKRAKPVVLLVYGDHKPAMGVFFDAGLFRHGWPGAVLDKYSTPLAIWATGTPGAGIRTGSLELSANFLSVELFRRLGIEALPSTFHYTARVYETFDIVSRVVRLRDGTTYAPDEVPEPAASLLRDYGFVKYHTLKDPEARPDIDR